MPDEVERICESWLRERRSEVTKNGAAWTLLQEPGFVGFGVVRDDKVCWPPGVAPDWDRVSDLRLFGEKGELHIWPHWDGTYRNRLLKAEDMKPALTEYHVLWGTELKSSRVHPWITLVETRGTEIWLPLASRLKSDDDLPVRLKLKQLIRHDASSGLAGIVDAALVALVDKEKRILPATC